MFFGHSGGEFPWYYLAPKKCCNTWKYLSNKLSCTPNGDCMKICAPGKLTYQLTTLWPTILLAFYLLGLGF
jgi:hypothetical protein